jgi:hypothetical protein
VSGMFSAASLSMIAKINRDALDAYATVERATPVATPGGGSKPAWGIVSPELTELRARVSLVGGVQGVNERATGGSARALAEYTVALDYTETDVAGLLRDVIRLGDRIQVRSDDASTPARGAAWAMTLYVVGFDGPQSFDPFPKVLTTTTPQPGQ